VCSVVRLLGSAKSGHNKRSDRPTVKNTDSGDNFFPSAGSTCLKQVDPADGKKLRLFVTNGAAQVANCAKF